MRLFDKLDRNIDYNNYYTLRRAICILVNEFNLAEKNKNVLYARDILSTLKQIYDKLSGMYRESADYGETMSYMHKKWANVMRNFIADFINRLKDF